jgi:hypothetical protein
VSAVEILAQYALGTIVGLVVGIAIIGLIVYVLEQIR